MKKTAVLLALLLICTALFGGCGTPDPLIVCSFGGEHDFFTVSNGVFGLCSTDDVFYGGILTPKQALFSDVAAYSATFFVQDGDRQHTLLSMHAEDTTGTPISVDQVKVLTQVDLSKPGGGQICFEVTDQRGVTGITYLTVIVEGA